MSAIFDWKRFWGPRGEPINLSDGGFLYDPESEYGKLLTPNLVTLNQLADTPCLALLGEPGIGKSWALKAEKERLGLSEGTKGAASIWLDLRSFGSEDRLWKTLFESAEFEQWRIGDHVLELFLDSLDECLLRIDNVAALLADQLPQEPTKRLRIRIACRTAPWPAILERGLTELYGNDGFKAYELAPLRRRDVQHALEKSGVTDVASFLGSVEALNASSFAIKPVTLNFLIKTYQRDGNLPANQIDLYERGCRILCQEASESRIASSKDTLDINHRLAIASRIAAVTQFCNRFAIWTGTEASVPSEDVSVNDLSGTEQIDGNPFAVSSGTIREVLDTGLFSSLGLGRSCWAHQTYAEFLAARYCVAREMPAPQIQGFLFHPEGGGQRLVPQLHETAAWLSVINPKLLQAVANADPEALLGAAAASLSDTQRRLIVQTFLDQSERGRLLNLRFNFYWAYSKLCHPTLDEQLRPYLTDSNRRQNTREAAVDIARACRLGALGPELTDLALDTSLPDALRIPAGAAAADIGSPEVKARLRPFAFGQAGEDPDDELKGIGLTAMWPDLIAAAELFPLLTRPKNSQLHGAYSSFLYDLGPKLATKDLPIALDWFRGQPHRDLGPIDALMDDIVRLAMENLDVPGVLTGLVSAILSRVRQHDQLMSGHDEGKLTAELQGNDTSRHLLLTELLPRISEEEIFFLDYAGLKMVPATDLPWLLRRLESWESEPPAQVEVKLIRRLVDTRETDQMRMLWSACQNHPALNAECKYLFFVALDSEEVRILREGLQYQRKREEKQIDPPPQARIEKDLTDFEQGKLSAWVQLTWDLYLTPTGTHDKGRDNPDMTASPGWQSSSGETRGRIQSAAFRYLNEGEPDNEKWFGTQEIYYSAIAGLQALGLLRSTAASQLDGVPNAAWKKWVPIILRYHYGDSVKLKLALLKDAYSRIPHDVMAYLMQTIDSTNEQFGYLFVGGELEACWDDRLATALLAKLKEEHLKPAVVGSLLQLIVEHGTTGSGDAAKSLIRVPPPELEPERSLMASTIEALIFGARDAGWPDVWPAIRDYPEFGRSMVESISYKHGGTGNFVPKLTEEQIGEFYTWMMVNYPPSSSDHRVAGAVGPKQTVVMLRDHTLEILKKRGTFAACEAIRDTMAKLPQYSWLALHLEEAESLARAATWQPITPRQFLDLASNHQKRLIENGQQLIAVVFESLNRLQAKLKGEVPAASDLWNADHGEYWPKDEEHLSGYVTRHLDADIQHRGVVVNREVQIRRGIGGGTGQLTDIHVDAVIPGAAQGTYARLYLIIEAKGNWNKELFRNMETQLRDRYLKDNRCRSGIYLVGWFSSPKWKDDDDRKRQWPGVTVTDARERLSLQALELSKDGFEISSYVLDIPLT